VADNYGQFRVGKTYEVIRAFRDYDGAEIAAGTRFTVVRLDFLPYEDGLTLTGDFTQHETPLERRALRLQDRPESQAAIIDPVEGFVVMARDGGMLSPDI
jgi:hypothetical protein